jgi:hypothetical protein
MIVGFRHKGLKRLFEKDDRAGIRPDLVEKVRTILMQLDEARILRTCAWLAFISTIYRATGKASGLSLSELTGESFSVLATARPTTLN